MSSMSLTFEANALLDAIDEKGPDEFSLSRLNTLRTEMLLAGFNAPFSAVLAMTKAEAEDWSPGEMEDSRKQIGNMRYIASLKKFTLNRVRAAVAAQKTGAALGKLGMANLALHLPLGGSYRKMLLAHGHSAVDAYRKLMSYFSIHSFDVQGASAVIMASGMAGEEIQASVQLAEPDGAEDKVREIFGQDAKILKLEKRKRKAGLIRNYSAKVALFTAASLHGAEVAKKHMEGVKKDAKIEEYNRFLSRHGLSEDADLSEAEGLEKIKAHAVKEGHLRFEKGEFVIDGEFSAALGKRRKERRAAAENAACEAVFLAIAREYALMNSAQRAAEGIPSLMPTPDEKQLAVLAHTAPEKYPLSHVPKVFAEKIEFEKKSLPIVPSVWGPAFVCARGKLGASWAANEFGANEKEIADAIPTISSLLAHPEGRGAKFLEGAKKAKQEGK